MFILEIQLCGNILDSGIHWPRSNSSLPLKCANANLQNRIITCNYLPPQHRQTAGMVLFVICEQCGCNPMEHRCKLTLSLKDYSEKNKMRKPHVSTFIIGELLKKSLWGNRTRKTSHERFTLNFKNLLFKIFILEDVLCVCLIQNSYWVVVERVINHCHLQSCCLGKSAHILTENYSVIATLYFWMCSM